MKRLNKKKGFTIVELVIVIAVVGVLTAVLVPTFVNLSNKAREAENQTYVKNLNTQMAIREATEGKNKTMYEAMMEAEDIGFNVEKLTPVNGNDVVWDSVANRFAIVDKDYATNGKVVYSEGDIQAKKLYQIWKIYDTMPTAQTYSIYTSEKWNVADLGTKQINVGFDSGKNKTIESVSYVGATSAEGKKEVIVRTNSASTALTILAEYDTVNHYGTVGKVDAQKIDMNCYNEFGKAAYVKVSQGKVVAKNGGSIGVVFAASNNNEKVAVIEESGAEIEKGLTLIEPVSTKNQTRVNGIALEFSIDGQTAASKTAEELAASLTEIEETTVKQAAEEAVTTALEEERKEEFSENNYWIGVAADNFAGGNGSESNPYQIATAEQLARLSYVMYNSKYSEYQDKYYKLTADINLSSKCWIPIVSSARGKDVNRYFTGTFDGDNHTISGLNSTGLSMSFIKTMTNDSTPVDGVEYVYGLFGDINGATIKNVKLANVNIKAGTGSNKDDYGVAYLSDSVGALVGYAQGNINISNCHTLSGTVEGYDGVSGLVGKAHDDSALIVIDGCSNAATINAIRRAAGIVGNIRGIQGTVIEENGNYPTKGVYVTNCSNSGIVTTLFKDDVGRITSNGTDLYDKGSNYYGAAGIANVNRQWNEATSGKNYNPAGSNQAEKNTLTDSPSFKGCTNTGTVASGIVKKDSNHNFSSNYVYEIAGGHN